MGVASYGEPYSYRERVGAMRQLRELPFRYRQPPSEALLGFPARAGGEIMDGPCVGFAAAAQKVVEDTMILLARSAVRMTGSADLCLDGGVALNCSANGRLHSLGDFEQVFIFPAAGDAGLSMGAALLTSAAAGKSVNARLEQVYRGPVAARE